MSQNENLPPLPGGYSTMSGTTAYTAAQMREYGQAAVGMHIEQEAEGLMAAYLAGKAAGHTPALPAEAAIATLKKLGYTYEGGVLWKPPIGPRPEWVDHPAWPWRTIDSAPKDGTPVIALAPWGGVYEARHEFDDWYVAGQGNIDATHWMPMPPLPEVKP